MSVTIIAGRIGNKHNDTDHEGESGNVEFSESCRTVGKVKFLIHKRKEGQQTLIFYVSVTAH